ncbi:hypothetical protein [Polymorphum gilvum]|uniref:Uncharacterized protein n=1 Tax=Polymorphum gilvum (strain LMG 25793 / CGMCC 1.9160 / SL003B-26A1) TaxID=991905 RepID=F2J5P0_POLGS|nr:hypothetical protein [Polymorphum gilvum]ADZ70124.1 hypothetical protein SL003B_1696 [Polymorphum gilvum SL003B-26A1]
MATPILDLETLITRPVIRIDGRTFELLSADELSILDSAWFTARGREIEQLAGSDDQEGAEALVGEVARRCLVDVPDDVFARLSGSQKMAIAEVFTRLLLRRKMRVAGAIATAMLASGETGKETAKPEPKRTGATSSRASSGTTAETRTGGSARRRRSS